jgi:hypothetical protein
VPYAGQDFEMRWYVSNGVNTCTAISITPTDSDIATKWPNDTANYNAAYGAPSTGTNVVVYNTQITGGGPDSGKTLRRSARHIKINTAGTYDVAIQCNGTSVRHDTVTVNPTPPVSINFFTASPSVVEKTEYFVLSWDTNYAGFCFEMSGTNANVGWPVTYTVGPNFINTAAWRNPSTGDTAGITFFRDDRLPLARSTVGANNSAVSGAVRISPITTPTTFRFGCYDKATDLTGFSSLTGTYVRPVETSVFVDVKGITLSASPASFTTAAAGNNSTLTWTLDAAREQSCARSSSPANPAWDTGSLPVTNSNLTVSSILTTTDFTITCQKTAAAGGGSESVTRQVIVGGPIITNFHYTPFPTATTYRKNVQGITYTTSPNTAYVTLKINELNKYIPMTNNTTYDTSTAPSSLPSSMPSNPFRWYVSYNSYSYTTGLNFYTFFGNNNVFLDGNGAGASLTPTYGYNPIIPAPTQKTTYTFTMTPYDSSWVPGTSAVTTVDVYPQNPVTIREGRSHLNGTNYNSPKTLPGGDPTQNITVNIFAYENGGYPSSGPGIVGSPTAYFKFDAGPNAKECYITRNNALVATITSPAPTDNIYYPTVFTAAPDAVSSAVPGINETRFNVSCYYPDGRILNSTNNIVFTYPPYITDMSATCAVNGSTPQMTLNYVLPTGATTAYFRAFATPGDVASACTPTTTPQTLLGGAYCDNNIGATGNNTYVLPNATPMTSPVANPTHPAPLQNKKYNYWLNAADQYGNWGDVSPWGALTDTSHRAFCPAPANALPVAVIDAPIVSLTKGPTDTITFTGHGTDADAGDTITQYYWAYYDSGGTLHELLNSTSSNTTVVGGFAGVTFTRTIPIGVYPAASSTGIFFKVKDSKDAWSLPVFVPDLTITPLAFSVDLAVNPTTPDPLSPITLTWTVHNGPADSCVASITRNGVAADATSAWVSPSTAKDVTGGSQGSITVPNMTKGTVQRYTITCVKGSSTDTGDVDITAMFRKGDGICDGSAGENVVNSPIDCKNAQFHETVQ